MELERVGEAPGSAAAVELASWTEIYRSRICSSTFGTSSSLDCVVCCTRRGPTLHS